MKLNPLVSVILPVFNTKLEWFRLALESILNQVYTNLEVIVIDDGSSIDILRPQHDYMQSKQDKRVIYIENSENNGIASVLNQAIRTSSGVLIARMDADDFALPNRIIEQVAYLKKNKNVSILGTWSKSFGDNNYIFKRPVGIEENKCHLLFKTTLTHPSVMIRKEVFEKVMYKPNMVPAEDYDFWVNAILNGFNIDNLPKILLKYRANNNSSKSYEGREKLVSEIHKKIIVSYFNYNPSIEDLKSHLALMDPLNSRSIRFEKIIEWCDFLQSLNNKLDNIVFRSVLSYYLWHYVFHTPSLHNYFILSRSNFNSTKIGFSKKIKFFFKIALLKKN